MKFTILSVKVSGLKYIPLSPLMLHGCLNWGPTSAASPLDLLSTQRPAWATRLCMISKPSLPCLWPAGALNFSHAVPSAWNALSHPGSWLVPSYLPDFILSDTFPEKPSLTTHQCLIPLAPLLSLHPFSLIVPIAICNSLSFWLF